MYTRTALLVGEAGVEKLKASKVLVIGLGGVGGHCAESLVRCGIGTIGLCDFDSVDVTNINRQAFALRSTVGMQKTDAALARLLDINPELRAKVYNYKLSPDNLDSLELENWDYIADCIDDVDTKVALARLCKEKGVNLISSMGTGNKLDSAKFEIAPLGKTEYDPLARKVRRLLGEDGKNLPVLFSKEGAAVEARGAMPSISYMPAIAGLKISEFIIKKLLQPQA